MLATESAVLHAALPDSIHGLAAMPVSRPRHKPALGSGCYMLHQHLIGCFGFLELCLGSCLGCSIRVLVWVPLHISDTAQNNSQQHVCWGPWGVLLSQRRPVYKILQYAMTALNVLAQANTCTSVQVPNHSPHRPLLHFLHTQASPAWLPCGMLLSAAACAAARLTAAQGLTSAAG